MSQAGWAITWPLTNVDGSPVTVTQGAWSNSPKSISYQWFACSQTTSNVSLTLPLGCNEISGATSNSVSNIPKSVLGFFLSVEVTATNDIASTSIWTITSPEVIQLASDSIPPTVTGTAVVGLPLTLSNTGSITAYPTPTLTYAWYDCREEILVGRLGYPPTCALIPGAFSSTYILQSSDVGFFVSGGVWANSPSFESVFISPTTPQVSAFAPTVPPTPRQAPVISQSGWSVNYWPYTTLNWGSLSVSRGTWANSPSAYAYQWFSCDSSVSGVVSAVPSGCTPIPGETSSKFSVTDQSLLGKYITVEVTTTNSFGSTSIWIRSSPEVVQPPTPAQTPSLSGAAQVGSTLSINPIQWSGFPAPSPYLSFSWYRCTSPIDVEPNMAIPSRCSAISGANQSTYFVQSSDVGLYITAVASREFYVQGISNGVGYFTPNSSAVIPAITPIGGVPSSITPPSITGVTNQNPAIALVSQDLNVARGSWGGSPPPLLSYQWYSCSDPQAVSSILIPSGCSAISGATGSSYIPSAGDLGKSIIVAETATRTGGSSTVWSASTLPTFVGPSNTSPPTVSGAYSLNGTLSLSPGIWAGNPSPTLTYQWYSCLNPVDQANLTNSGTTPLGCTPIDGATSTNYVLQSSDVGKYISVGVRGTDYLPYFSTYMTKWSLSTPIITS